MARQLALLLLLVGAVTAGRFAPQGVWPGAPHVPHPQSDVGDPLFLTPLIEAGQLDQARAAARVGPVSPSSSSAGQVTPCLTLVRVDSCRTRPWRRSSRTPAI